MLLTHSWGIWNRIIEGTHFKKVFEIPQKASQACFSSSYQSHLHQYIFIQVLLKIFHLFSQKNHVFYHQFHLGNKKKQFQWIQGYEIYHPLKFYLIPPALNSTKICLVR